ncbi:MAG: Biotin operon repressor / Biotin--protein ligase [Ktedonobacterales bacterium]|jgi:BirA family biotin operon repressor/biotin-[acetyl-CoA-carboxylase] ligase|nr:MAG: Biotin operon repressor / Biotin--protein ligase [Ktedonobacterales bacterium]
MSQHSGSNDNGAGRVLDTEAVRAGVRELRLGSPLLYFPSINSTNTYAASLARGGATEGTLLVSDDQTAGRGRIGRIWKSLPGQQLSFSLVLRPAFPPHFLVMASALAVAEAITAITSLETGIKWPNDVQVDGYKICGILIETSPGYAILGIGINVNGSLRDDPELAARAITLADAAGHDISREDLLIAILCRLDTLYSSLTSGGDPAWQGLRSDWRARLVTLGRRITLLQGEHTVTGHAEDVDANGALLLRLDGGVLQTVTWGDVQS